MRKYNVIPILVIGFILYLMCSSCNFDSISTCDGDRVIKIEKKSSTWCRYYLTEGQNYFIAPCNNLKIGDTIQIILKHN